MSNPKWNCVIAVVFALIIVVGVSAQTDQGQRDPVVSRWQHLSLTVDLKNDIKPAGGGINQLGNEGWQLVDVENFISDGETTKTVYYFKRPQ